MKLSSANLGNSVSPVSSNGCGPERAQVELGGLWRPREVGHAQDRLVFELADEREDLPVRRREQRQGAPAEGAVAAAQGDRALHPVQQRGRRALLRLDVASLVPVDGVHDDRRKETGGIRAREAAVAIRCPRIGVTTFCRQDDVVAHPVSSP
jgi:hypothetical protein